MYQYRVTKYDPLKRDRWGAYPADDWISQCQIGETFGGIVLTQATYQRTEDAYVRAALAFIEDSGEVSLRIAYLENYKNHQEEGLLLREGSVLGELEIATVCRLNLRGMIWCKLEDERRFIHFGYDYYMYIGVPVPCEDAKALASRVGLFVEEFKSPHCDDENL